MTENNQKLSFQVKFYIIVAIVIIHLLFSLNFEGNDVINGKLRNVENYTDIENQSIFNFSIISDNHGQSPYENIYMAKANFHIRKSNDLCVLGMGDHLTKTGTNDFLFFVCNDSYWKNNFYPTISDNENAFYGNGQTDWGAGKPFFDAVDLTNRKNIKFSNEGVDYYAIIDAPKGYKIHWISLHFPDEPNDTKLAFKESSKYFLRQSLISINKTNRDIIVIGAHSRFGSWMNEVNQELSRLIMTKADLVLGASTHYYERYTLDGYENKGPLLLNTGSVIYPRFGSQPGFIQIHVMEQHRGLYVHYVDVSKPTTIIKSSPFAYFKSFDGKIYDVYYPTVM